MDFHAWPPLLVVDVEGNGATPPDLVEIATVPITDGSIDDDQIRDWLIRPPRPITRFATGVHGITNSAVADATAWTDVATDVSAELEGLWIAAHNASVEYRVLKAHLRHWEPAGVIDTLRLSRVIYSDGAKHNLDAAIVHAGIDTARVPGDRHRAGFDAAVTALLLLELAGHFDSFGDLVAAGVPVGMPGHPTTPIRSA